MNHRSALLAVCAICTAMPAAADRVGVVSETGEAALVERVRGQLNDVDSPASPFEARRQARRAAERAEAFLNSIGYLAPDISHAVDAGPPLQGMVKVEPGKRFTVKQVEIDWQGGAPGEAAEAAIAGTRTLSAGDPAIPRNLIDQETDFIAALRAAGFVEAAAGERVIEGDREAGEVAVTYRIAPGPRIRFGEVRFDQGTRTRQLYLDRLVPFARGDIATPAALSRLNGRLSALRIFRVGSARLADTASGVAEDGAEIRDVIVTLEEQDRYTLSIGASFSTAEGVGATSSLTRRNATRRGDTFTGTLTIAALERAIGAQWRIPNAVAYDQSLVFSAEATEEETNAFDREALIVSGAYEVRHSPQLTYTLSAESEFTREIDALGQRDLQVLSASIGARLDRSDDPLDPTRGWRADLRAEPALALGDRSSQFFTLNGQVAAYQPLMDDRLIAVLRIRNGYVFGASIGDLPVSRRFFAGGGGSARGFEFQFVGPRDEDGQPIGGRGLLEGSAELRWRGDGNFGYVVFLDAATVSDTQAARLDELRYSAGIGVRYDTVVGPIRFDIATPLDPKDGEDPVQFYVSIGQAF